MEKLKLLAFFLLLVMFLLSGVTKVAKLGCCEHKELEWLGFSKQVSQVGVFCVGVFEVLAFVLFFYAYATKRVKLAKAILISLMVFVIVVTIIYKVAYKFRKHAFLSNVSLLGGLMLGYLLI